MLSFKPWYSFRTALLPFVSLCAFMLSLCLSPAHGALTLTKSVSAATAAPGSTVTYTLAYGNNGSSQVGDSTISDTLPANVTYVQGSASGGATYTPGPPTR